jgi:hypothetical protein
VWIGREIGETWSGLAFIPGFMKHRRSPFKRTWICT